MKEISTNAKADLDRHFGGPTSPKEGGSASGAVTMAAVVVTLALSLAIYIPIASAGSAGPLQPLVNVATLLFVVGLIGGLVGGVLHIADVGAKYTLPVLVVSGILLVVGVGGWVTGWIYNVDPEVGPDEPPVPEGYVAQWDCDFVTLAAGGPGGAHDAVTEFPDTPWTAADGGTPDWNSVIATPVYDAPAGLTTIDVSVDDDVTPATAGYLDEDAYAFDLRCKLLNPIPAVAGGNQEVPLWGRISASRVAGTNNNGSFAPVFRCDVTAGHYLGWGTIADSGAAADGHDADHSYVSYTNAIVCPSAPPLVGDWQPLGTSDGDPDGEWVSIWFVLDTGFSDYTSPPLGSSVYVNAEIGTRPDSTSWRGNVVQATVDLNLLARA